MDQQPSMRCDYQQPSVRCPVSVAGDGDASVPMEPEGDNGQQLISSRL